VLWRPRPVSKPLVLFALIACLVPLGYARYTHHAWEDFFITFRHSQNLCEGKGLVYNPGERVHGFTSPVGVLLPALGYWITGQHSYLHALWFFRILSSAAFALAGVLLWRVLGRQMSAPRVAQLFFALLYVLEAKSVAFSANGMETGFMLLFVAWGLSASSAAFVRGLCWAGLMWTRPDGCVFITVLAFVDLVYSDGERRRLVWSWLSSAAVCLAAYLPWLGWAWWYYGSPIPNTLLAKATHAAPIAHWSDWLQRIYEQLPHQAAAVFSPIYYGAFWIKPEWINTYAHVLGVFCALYWLIPVADRLGRRASLAFALLTAYVSSMPIVFPWYLPPVTLCGLVVLARGPFFLAEKCMCSARLAQVAAAAVLLLIGGEMAYVFRLTVEQMRIQQKEIEMGTRAQVGRWLKEHVSPGETVYLEALGYIGYFSQATMRDWPGLVAPEVVRLLRDRTCNCWTAVAALQPDWIVLRPSELEYMAWVGFFRDHYRAVQVFDARPNLQRYHRVPGKGYLVHDATFLVFQKQPRSLHPGAPGA
jgi:hypothetical protein